MITKLSTGCVAENPPPAQKRICPVCGTAFYPKSIQNHICSRACREENKFRLQESQQNRPFTSSTVYLIHKYYTEGDSIEDIMDITGRSRSSVIKALTQNINQNQKNLINRYLIVKLPMQTDKGGKI